MPEPGATCWSCGAARAPGDALCPSCGKVQPPAPGTARDKFAVLGLPRGYDVDGTTLDEQFRALSRKLHPDRFARASAKERRFSLEQTTLVNDAYRTLRDPARRAEHLLELRGVRPVSDTAMPEEFLEEAMADREKLLDARMEGGNDSIEQLAAGIRQKRDAAMQEIGRVLGASDPGPADLTRVSELLARLRYYARYLDEAAGRAPEM
ncbi:MAG: Fe-S protein assembly co-chaperone HscB [Myxococcales bacterium]